MTRALNALLIASFAVLTLGPSAALANPTGSSVVAGTAAVAGQGTADVVVTQTTDKAIIDWLSFNIGSGETTQFVQPSTSSVTLNRVTGGLGASQINGALNANGNVFLINPDGILFGKHAKVDVGGLVATTNDIDNADFMAGDYAFTKSGKADASIVNAGTITAENGGFAALVAPGVRNSGTITATLGNIGLASANSFTLDLYGDQLLTLSVNDQIAATVKDVQTGKPLSALVKNTGKLKADGGTVQLTAAAARTVVDSVINNTGVIEANSVGLKNGRIVLSAATAATKPAGTPVQTVQVSGTLSAAGKGTGQMGGKVEITGENITLTAATIDASGSARGGTVLVGGDISGGNPNPTVQGIAGAALESTPVPTAADVFVDSSSTINASGLDAGNGGKVIVWADDATTFAGSITAKGGSTSGNGGFVETSGHQALDYRGSVDTSATAGNKGTLLLDPLDVVIGGTGSSGLSVWYLEAALATNDVVVTTGSTGTDTGNITVARNVAWGSDSSLTLDAYNDIIVDSGVTISNTGAGNLNLRADANSTGVGSVVFLGTGKLDYSQSAGLISIFYDPTGALKYQNPVSYAATVLTNPAVSNQLTSYMLVNNVDDLQNINQNLVGDYALGTNIDASDTSGWTAGYVTPGTFGFYPIGNATNPFSGILEGDGHNITGLTINAALDAIQTVGIFGTIAAPGRVSDLSLTNVWVSASNFTSILPTSYVGSMTGINYGTLTNIVVSGSIAGSGPVGSSVGGIAGENCGSILSSESSASVVGGSYLNIGGLVGINSGTILNSSASGRVTGTTYTSSTAGGLVGLNQSGGEIRQSWATGDVEGDQPGGFVGENDGSIFQAYATGYVFGTGSAGGFVAFNLGSIDQASATGNVGALDGAGAGGFVGQNWGTISNAYSRGSAWGPAYFVYAEGGFAGYQRGGTISESYSTGAATEYYNGQYYPASGFVGYGGGVSLAYWDEQTSGDAYDGAGATPMTTAALTGQLPVGFDPTVWGINPTINNGYPYLLWAQQNTSPPPPPNEIVFTPPFAAPPPSLPPDVSGSQQTAYFSPWTGAGLSKAELTQALLEENENEIDAIDAVGISDVVHRANVVDIYINELSPIPTTILSAFTDAPNFVLGWALEQFLVSHDLLPKIESQPVIYQIISPTIPFPVEFAIRDGILQFISPPLAQ